MKQILGNVSTAVIVEGGATKNRTAFGRCLLAGCGDFGDYFRRCAPAGRGAVNSCRFGAARCEHGPFICWAIWHDLTQAQRRAVSAVPNGRLPLPSSLMLHSHRRA